MATSSTIDLSLLEGMSFACRPDCGLCCYTTPAVSTVESERLIQLDPQVPFLDGDEGWRYVSDQGEGGACHFLSKCRCRAYDRRPFCCEEFPLSVHVGERAQATGVLSCPGLTVRGWGSPAGADLPSATPEGLSTEISAVELEFHRQPIGRRVREGSRRWRSLKTRLSRSGGWAEPSEIRATLKHRIRDLVEGSYPPPPPPPVSGGIDALPLWFEPGVGLIAIADHASDWELISVEETGTASRSLGVWPAASRPPSVTPSAGLLLERYLGYLLDRDFTYWSAAERVRADGGDSFPDAVADDIGRFGALVLARAQLVQKFRSGGSGPLSDHLVWDGIRATDGEFLDRPTLGWVL